MAQLACTSLCLRAFAFFCFSVSFPFCFSWILVWVTCFSLLPDCFYWLQLEENCGKLQRLKAFVDWILQCWIFLGSEFASLDLVWVKFSRQKLTNIARWCLYITAQGCHRPALSDCDGNNAAERCVLRAVCYTLPCVKCDLDRFQRSNVVQFRITLTLLQGQYL